MVQLVGLDHFELAKELLKNKLKIVWVTKLKQAQNEEEVSLSFNTQINRALAAVGSTRTCTCACTCVECAWARLQHVCPFAFGRWGRQSCLSPQPRLRCTKLAQVCYTC